MIIICVEKIVNTCASIIDDSMLVNFFCQLKVFKQNSFKSFDLKKIKLALKF